MNDFPSRRRQNIACDTLGSIGSILSSRNHKKRLAKNNLRSIRVRSARASDTIAHLLFSLCFFSLFCDSIAKRKSSWKTSQAVWHPETLSVTAKERIQCAPPLRPVADNSRSELVSLSHFARANSTRLLSLALSKSMHRHTYGFQLRDTRRHTCPHGFTRNVSKGKHILLPSARTTLRKRRTHGAMAVTMVKRLVVVVKLVTR